MTRPRWSTSGRIVHLGLSAGYVFIVLFALTWPAWINGYPLVYDDTGVYIGYSETLFWAYPPLYILGVRAIGKFFALDGVVLMQGAVSCYVLVLAFMRFGRMKFFGAALAVVGLATFTQLPWLVAWLTPDVFGGLGLLSLLVLAFTQRRRLNDLLLLLVVLGAGLVATSNGLVTLIALPLLLIVRRTLTRSALDRATLAGSLVLASLLIVVPPVTNKLLQGQFVYATGSSARMFSTLVDRSLAQPYLASACARGDDQACSLAQSIARFVEDEEFLWGAPNGRALADTYDAWNDRDGSFGRYSRQIIFSNPIDFAVAALADTARLSGHLTLGREGRELIPHASKQSSVYGWMLVKYPDQFDSFLLARQQRGTIMEMFPAALYVLVTILSYVAVLLMIPLAWRRGDRTLLSLLLATAGLLILSTAVHGGLSATVARYTVKSSWLAGFAALVAFSRLIGASSLQAAAVSRDVQPES